MLLYAIIWTVYPFNDVVNTWVIYGIFTNISVYFCNTSIYMISLPYS